MVAWTALGLVVAGVGWTMPPVGVLPPPLVDAALVMLGLVVALTIARPLGSRPTARAGLAAWIVVQGTVVGVFMGWTTSMWAVDGRGGFSLWVGTIAAAVLWGTRRRAPWGDGVWAWVWAGLLAASALPGMAWSALGAVLLVPLLGGGWRTEDGSVPADRALWAVPVVWATATASFGPLRMGVGL